MRYVLATKYKDGGPKDQWCIGFLKNEIAHYSRPRYNVVDCLGMPFRGNGFRKVIDISINESAFLLANAKAIENGNKGLYEILEDYREAKKYQKKKIGEKRLFKNARNKIWELEGYSLQEKNHC